MQKIIGCCLFCLISVLCLAQEETKEFAAELSSLSGNDRVTFFIDRVEVESDTNLEQAFAIAKETLQLAHKWNDRHLEATALFQAGMITKKLNQFDQALQYFSNASELYHELDKTKELEQIYVELAYLNHGLGKFDDALSCFTETLHLNEKMDDKDGIVRAHNNIGILLAKTGRYDEAMPHFLKALKIYPDYGGAHYNLGLLFANIGQPDEAIAHYRKALELDPNNGDAHYNLNLLLAKTGRSDEATANSSPLTSKANAQ